MKIENTFDEVLFAALVGLEPDDEDLARVRVPAGEDDDQFLDDLRSIAKDIAANYRDGSTGDARRIAQEAQQQYLDKFAALLPIPAHTDETPLNDVGARVFGKAPSNLNDTATRMFRS